MSLQTVNISYCFMGLGLIKCNVSVYILLPNRFSIAVNWSSGGQTEWGVLLINTLYLIEWLFSVRQLLNCRDHAAKLTKQSKTSRCTGMRKDIRVVVFYEMFQSISVYFLPLI